MKQSSKSDSLSALRAKFVPQGSFNATPYFAESAGLGAMLALKLVKDRETKAPATDAAKTLTRLCYEKGLVILS